MGVEGHFEDWVLCSGLCAHYCVSGFVGQFAELPAGFPFLGLKMTNKVLIDSIRGAFREAQFHTGMLDLLPAVGWGLERCEKTALVMKNQDPIAENGLTLNGLGRPSWGKEGRPLSRIRAPRESGSMAP